MKYDLKKSQTTNSTSIGMAPISKDVDAAEYPTACLYDLPKDLKGIHVGDSITLTTTVKSLREGEKGIESIDLNILSMEDKKKDIKMKKVTDADAIDKGVDEAAEEKDEEVEEKINKK